jgi:peptide/nickel transport system substrate-binding protein
VVARAGGPHAARATCHLLPPTFPGYRPGCPSGASRPDLPAARRLVARSGTRGARVVLWTGTIAGFEPLTPPLTRALRSLGYRVTVRHAGDRYFGLIGDPSTRAQAGPDGYIADFPSPSTFLNLLSCRTQDRSPPRFCDPAADSLLRRAGALQASDPRAADALWAKAERRMLRAAPLVPLFNPVDSNVVSTRLRNDQYSPQITFLPDQAWVR